MLRPLWLFTSSYRQNEMAALRRPTDLWAQIAKMLAVFGGVSGCTFWDRRGRAEPGMRPMRVVAICWIVGEMMPLSAGDGNFWSHPLTFRLTCDWRSHPLQWLANLR